MATFPPLHRAALLALPIVVLCSSGCDRRDSHAVFRLLSPSETGVAFANTITTNDSLNVQREVYVYNGAGVGVGDIDNDGLPDIFFAGNMVSSRLYRNTGKMHFEDITTAAGVSTKSWATGVAMVDINGDGYLDIYVSVSGPDWTKGSDRANLLFVNNGNRTFTEEGARYGVADTGFTTQAAFLDYDGDGCLDLFLLENSPADFSRGDIRGHPGQMRGTTPGSYNQLLHNDCHGHFDNVSEKAGILREGGYGLGVAVADINGDGRPDIYVSNDAAPNDVIYVNNGDGTFTNKAGRYLKHASVAGMGVDVADFNNDGWPDIMQVDMLPSDPAHRKRTTGDLTYANRVDSRSRGYREDFTANSLQLSNGITRDGDVVFSEMGRMAGVSATDWSWSPLFADFDNDGNKDIFIGNGYPKAVNDLDYIAQMRAIGDRGGATTVNRAKLDLLQQLPAWSVPDRIFRNDGDLSFTDESKRWGLDQPSFSYGAAYADLDNDGQLDLVVNNIDAPAFIYHNVQPSDSTHHYLNVKLDGAMPNGRGIGATVIVTTSGRKQYVYQSPYRGFMSSVDDRLHFGLGDHARADSVEVIWPDGRSQRLTNVAANQLLVLKQSDAAKTTPAPPLVAPPEAQPMFSELDAQAIPAPTPARVTLPDYSVQPLLPYMISAHGPPLAVADVNGDGLDDVYIGGGAGVAGALLLQRPDGGFSASTVGQPWEADRDFDDWGALFFDANGDGRPDLYVASGGYQPAPSSRLLQDRLYINQGNGRFVRDSAALPEMLTSTATVRAADFNGDGRLDLFVGGRLTPRAWPSPTRSYVLRNDGGHFTDVTARVAPALANPGGMITDALWVDFDGDGRVDLVTAGEWMPIQFYHNDGRQLHDVTAKTSLPPTRGWWYSLAAGDFDHDGRIDIVAGNLGLNYSYTTGSNRHFGVYAGPFSGGLHTDVVLTEEIAGKEHSYAGLDPLGREIYTLGIKFPTYGSLADASIDQLFTAGERQQAVHYQADTFASVVLRNEGKGVFALTELPNMAQIAPIRGIVVHDVDGDGNLDLIVAGNLDNVEPNTPPADAGNGLWLRGDGHGRFIAVPPRASGLLAPHDVTGMALLKTITGVGM
ncbi:MAG: VCBS repeat-containing protein, partial [Gemmatimonadaceae bacterium]